jgi:hypothetical protein
MIHPGRYRHYKGNDYEVIGIARHSETEEELAVYRKLYGDGSFGSGRWRCSPRRCWWTADRYLMLPGWSNRWDVKVVGK